MRGEPLGGVTALVTGATGVGTRAVGQGMRELGIEGITDHEEIGRGGFGVVYRATETDLRRSVAVKILPSDLDQRGRDDQLLELRWLWRYTHNGG